MPIGSEVLLAGQYTVTLGGTALGIMEGDGGVPTIEKVDFAEMIENTDAYGKMRIDGIFQGTNWSAQYVCEEYKAGSKSAFNPYHATMGRFGVIARLLYDLSSALVLTAVSGTPAHTAGDPLTLTASKAILEPGYPVAILFGPTLRKVPIRQILFPYLSTGNPVHYVQT